MSRGWIDSHLHLWDRGTSEYAWITPELGELDADFSAADAFPHLDRAGVDAVVLVQADDSAADTRFMLEVAANAAWVAGVVGWVPLQDPVASQRMLDEWIQHPRFRGVRQLVHIDPRDDVLDDPGTIATLRAIALAGLAFDLPDAWPRHLSAVPRIVASAPDLVVIVDHLGKPPLGSEGFADWAASIRDAATCPSTFAKVSGLQGLTPHFTAREVWPAWEVALEAFGPARLMFGSDWPVTLGHGGYPATVTVFDELIAQLSPHEQAEIRSGTARRAYGLPFAP